MKIDLAKFILTSANINFRIVEEDGKGSMLTQDINLERLNLKIRNKYITDVYIG